MPPGLRPSPCAQSLAQVSSAPALQLAAVVQGTRASAAVKSAALQLITSSVATTAERKIKKKKKAARSQNKAPGKKLSTKKNRPVASEVQSQTYDHSAIDEAQLDTIDWNLSDSAVNSSLRELIFGSRHAQDSALYQYAQLDYNKLEDVIQSLICSRSARNGRRKKKRKTDDEAGLATAMYDSEQEF